ncbi:creatininase family protein [Halomarina halobia]|uniref:Creatininase family protein n=1 Tax=Halomarina halobia TaxID=3033386 RepID=A0ABD6AAF3_9EURY|nr:creatininase family protein [Halomarina sp. PSR21]
MRLAEQTWTDVAEADARLAFLPTGSTEQHGPHAPLGTDATTAEAVAEAGAAVLDGDAVVAPTIPVGIAEEHRSFDGTLWVTPDTFRRYVREVIESLAYHDLDRVVVVNGHGGNVDALEEVCARVTRDGTARAVPFTWFAGGSPDLPMGHGGARETALLRHVAPDLVREDRVEAAREGAADRWGEWVAGVNLAYDSDEFSGNGVVGDPGAGSAADGEALLAAAAERLAAVATAVDERAERNG